MGNVDINTIRRKGFAEGSDEEKIEKYCIEMAGKYTDSLIDSYCNLSESRNGKYINSDLMKMVFPFYAQSMENRRKYNMSVTNTAAVLTNETYKRAILDDDVDRCIYIVGPYGAGKSFFAQSLFENGANDLEKAIVYEGSITPPAFEEKIQYAIENGVIPEIIALNPTLELSIRNIRERAGRIGRDVEKAEVVSKFAGFYEYFKGIIEKYPNMPYAIYNKTSNLSLDINKVSTNIDDIMSSKVDDISKEYDRITELLNKENQIESFIL